MQHFAAIDFETANECRTSVCSVGLVVVREGVVEDTFYSLIRPEPDYYKWFATRVHGLTAEDTESAPLFCDVWGELEQRIEGLPLVAHNSAFDQGCLRAVCSCYRIDYPEPPFYCTYRAARRAFPHLPNHQLHTVAAAVGYNLTAHHHALADAEACAAIALQIL